MAITWNRIKRSLEKAGYRCKGKSGRGSTLMEKQGVVVVIGSGVVSRKLESEV